MEPLDVPPSPVALGKGGPSPEGGSTSLSGVGGCLAGHWLDWQTIGADSKVMSILQDGYLDRGIMGVMDPRVGCGLTVHA